MRRPGRRAGLARLPIAVLLATIGLIAPAWSGAAPRAEARSAWTGSPRLHAASFAGLDRIQADVGGDAKEPGSNRDRTPKGVPALPRPGEGFLERILGLVDGAHHPVAMGEQLTPVTRDVVPEQVRRIELHLPVHSVR